MAPEYVMHGHLSVKADVFSFGVVMLELISGQRNSNFNLDPDAQNLLDWVRSESESLVSLAGMKTLFIMNNWTCSLP